MDRKMMGRQKRRYTRGIEYGGLILLLTANAKLFEASFNNVGLGFTEAFVGFGAVYVFLCWAAGFIDEQWGIWKEENDHGWAVTPKADRLCQRVGKIAKQLEIPDKDNYSDLTEPRINGK